MSAARIAANLRGTLAFSGPSVISSISRIQEAILAQILPQADGASCSHSLRQDPRTRLVEILVIAAGQERQAALFEHMIEAYHAPINAAACRRGARMKRVILTAVLAMVFVTALLLPAWSQRADRLRRVGVLVPWLSSDPAKRPPELQALLDGLREHGWEEGRNVVLEVRYADLDPARLLELAAELGAFKADVIMVSDTQALDAARRKAAKIPIVMAGAGVPVSLGFIESLARPGGNITGVVNQTETIHEKNLELLKEISPGMERVGIVHTPENVSSLAGIKREKEQIGPRLGLVVVLIPVSRPADLDEAFATIVRERVQALLVHGTTAISAQRGRIAG